MHDPVLLIGYMAAVCLTAVFLVRPLAGGAAGRGLARLGWPALRIVAAAVLMLPAPALFGPEGLAALGLVALAVAVASAIRWALAGRRQSGERERAGEEWTPLPAILVLLEQTAVAGFVLLAWLALREAPLQGWFVDLTTPHPGIVGAIDLWGPLVVVGVALLVANTVAAGHLVSLLLPPATDAEGGRPEHGAGYTVKLGLLSGRIEADKPPTRLAGPAVPSTRSGPPSAPWSGSWSWC